MIEITKEYWKWKVGAKPDVSIGLAQDLVEGGYAKWEKDWNEYGYKKKIKTKKQIKENGNNREA